MALSKWNTKIEGLIIKVLRKLHYEPGSRTSFKSDIPSYAIVLINFLVLVFSVFIIKKATVLSCLIALCNILKNFLVFYRDNKVLAKCQLDETGNYPSKFTKSPYDYLLLFSTVLIVILLFSSICIIVLISRNTPRPNVFFSWIVGFNMFFTYFSTVIVDVSKIYRSKPVFK